MGWRKATIGCVVASLALWSCAEPAVDLEPVTPPAPGLVRQSLGQRISAQHETLDRLQQQPAMGRVARAQVFGELGKLYLVAGLPNTAAACFRNAALLAPDDPGWPRDLGHTYGVLGESHPAIDSYRLALQLDPEDAVSHEILGNLLLAQGQLDDAALEFRQAIELRPASASALFGLGQIAIEHGDPASAREHLQAAAVLAPGAGSIHHALGAVLLALGEEQAAQPHLDFPTSGMPLLVDPLVVELAGLAHDPTVPFDRGIEALDAGRWGDAVTYFNEALRIAPNNTAVRLNLGTALARQGNRGGALEQFERALEMQPDNAHTLLALGALYADRDSTAEALDYLRRAVAADEQLAGARIALADELLQNGDYEEALDEFSRVALDAEVGAEAQLGRTHALIRLERYVEARAALDLAVESFPGEGVFVMSLARLLATCPRQGVRDGARATKLAGTLVAGGDWTVESAQTMAMALAETGRFTDAAVWQERAIAAALTSGSAGGIERLRNELDGYRAGQPSREYWVDQ